MRKIILIIGILLAPLWIIGLSTRMAFSEWFIEYEYSKKDFPKDRWGLPDNIRKELAKIGLEAVLSDKGLEKFRNAKLPNGKKAFRKKEIKHMEDVKNFLKYFFPVVYISFVVWFGIYFFLKQIRWKLLLISGAFTTFLIVFAGLFAYFNYELAFAIFHDYLFGKYTWRFRWTDTLLRIYPMKFWYDGTFFVIGLSLLISVTLYLLGLLLKNVYEKV
ncbi:TIGR01906 family membrane protein [Persephonella sp.]